MFHFNMKIRELHNEVFYCPISKYRYIAKAQRASIFIKVKVQQYTFFMLLECLST
jgi:hypothetical protein